MNEYIEVNFTRSGKAWPIRKQLSDGQVEFDEADPIPRRIGVYLEPLGEATATRMRWVRQKMGWYGQDFQLSMRAEGGALVLRGVRENDNDEGNNLPPGLYSLKVQVEEAKAVKQGARFTLAKDGYSEVSVGLETDRRQVIADVSKADPLILALLGSSEFDGAAAIDWLADQTRRPSRKACFLNLLASLRSRPGVGTPLISHVSEFYWCSNDRAYARADARILATLEALASDDSKPFYREGRPTAKVHEALVDSIPPSEVHLYPKERLLSFRGENSPSLQVVVAPPTEGSQAYVEFDLDLGNALQDLWGLIVHAGELVDGKPTDHIDMRKKLVKTKAAPYLCYTIQMGA